MRRSSVLCAAGWLVGAGCSLPSDRHPTDRTDLFGDRVAMDAASFAWSASGHEIFLLRGGVFGRGTTVSMVSLATCVVRDLDSGAPSGGVNRSVND